MTRIAYDYLRFEKSEISVYHNNQRHLRSIAFKIPKTFPLFMRLTLSR